MLAPKAAELHTCAGAAGAEPPDAVVPPRPAVPGHEAAGRPHPTTSGMDRSNHVWHCCSAQPLPAEQGAGWDARLKMERSPAFCGHKFGRKAPVLGQFSSPFVFSVA